MLGDFVVIYSTDASNVHVTILENSINCSDISRSISKHEPITSDETSPSLTANKKSYGTFYRDGNGRQSGSIITKL